MHEAGRAGSRGSRLNDQDLDLAELSEISSDALTFPEAYNILLEAVGSGLTTGLRKGGSPLHLSRQRVRALADRELRLQQSVVALLDVLMPGFETQIFAVDELDHIEFMTNTLDDLTRRIAHAGEDEEAGEDEPNLLADLRAIVHNNVEEVEG